MRKKGRLFLFFTLLFAVSNLFGQTSDEEKLKEKQKQELEFIDSVLADAKNLVLAENRALVYAKAANALWERDEKRARELFQTAFSELISAQNEVTAEKRSQKTPPQLLYGQTPRWEMLFLFAGRDPEKSLEMRVKTRPPELPASIEGFSDRRGYSNVFYYVKAELQNEQRLLTMVAEKSPARTAELLRESLKKPISYETLNLFRKLVEKDLETATELADEIVEKFLARDLTENNDEMNVLSQFLNEFGNERAAGDKSLRLKEAQIRALAGKMLDVWLAPETVSLYGYSDLKIHARFFPDRVAKVREKHDRQNYPNQTEEYKEYMRLTQSNLSAEELFTEGAKLPLNFRSSILYQAADKFAQNGNFAQAEKIIKEIYPDQADFYLSNWQSGAAGRAAAEGNFAEARRLIAGITNDEMQINALINLAATIFNKDPKENKTQALSIFDEARALLPERPESYTEMNAAMNLAAQMAGIEPTRSFEIIESMLTPMNELADAQAVLARYNPQIGSSRKGEFLLMSAGSAYGAYNLPNVLSVLKSNDAGRVLKITNRLNRLDVRLSIQIQLLPSDLQTQIINLPINTRQFIKSGG